MQICEHKDAWLKNIYLYILQYIDILLRQEDHFTSCKLKNIPTEQVSNLAVCQNESDNERNGITLPLFLAPLVPCITMLILELVPAPLMLPVTTWTLYTMPAEFGGCSGYSYMCIQSETPASRVTSHTLRGIIVSHEVLMIRLTVMRLILPKWKKRQSVFFLSASVGVLLNDAYRLCLTEPFS